MVPGKGPRRMPVILSSYRLGPGQRASYKTVPPPWDWLLRRENELGPRRSKSQIIFAVLVPPFYVAVQAPALIVTYFATEWMLKKHKDPPFTFICTMRLFKMLMFRFFFSKIFKYLQRLSSSFFYIWQKINKKNPQGSPF